VWYDVGATEEGVIAEREGKQYKRFKRYACNLSPRADDVTSRLSRISTSSDSVLQISLEVARIKVLTVQRLNYSIDISPYTGS
jgi:hypothetical protein